MCFSYSPTSLFIPLVFFFFFLSSLHIFIVVLFGEYKAITLHRLYQAIASLLLLLSCYNVTLTMHARLPFSNVYCAICTILSHVPFLSIDVSILYFHTCLPSQVGAWHQRRLTKLLTKWWRNLISVKMSRCPMQTLSMSSPKHPTSSTYSGSHFSEHYTLFIKYEPDPILMTRTHMLKVSLEKPCTVLPWCCPTLGVLCYLITC